MRAIGQFVAISLVGVAAAVFALSATAQSVACWQAQTSQILAHTPGQTTGVFELSGRAHGAGAGELRFACNGTFLLSGAQKQYNYACDVFDQAGEKFALQNNGDTLGATHYVSGGGTGKYAELTGAAPAYAQFPVNADGGLPSCDATQSAFRLP